MAFHMELALFLLQFQRYIIHTNSGDVPVSLEQSVPPNNFPVCPGEMLVFTCISENVLTWQEGTKLFVFNDPEKVNTTREGERFTFLLVGVNGTFFTSTATIPIVSTADHNLLLSCTAGPTILSRNVVVAGQPSSCHGTVSCRVQQNYLDETMSDITVTLNNSPSNQMCVMGYHFSFNNELKYVGTGSSPSATFAIRRDLAMEHLNQAIFTLDADNRTGEETCSYSITEPNEVPEEDVFIELTCSNNLPTLTLMWSRPSLGVENCLVAEEIDWMYTIVLSDNSSSLNHTTILRTHTFEGLSEMGEYNLSITAMITHLTLSGPPIFTSINITDPCSESTEGGTELPLEYIIPLGLVSVFALLFLILFIISLAYMYRVKIKGMCTKCGRVQPSDDRTMSHEQDHPIN